MAPSSLVESPTEDSQSYNSYNIEENPVAELEQPNVKRTSQQSLNIKIPIKDIENSITDTDTHDKRSHPDDGDIGEQEGGGKRRESDGKVSKKLGRKPIISEPTTKRKAQNRAAQRAFRERKEKYLKDLQTKVEDLEAASESANYENSILRAQIEKISTELQEYRKRFSLIENENRISSSASNNQSGALLDRCLKNYDMNNLNDFNFEFNFSKFGYLPDHSLDINMTRNSSIPHQITPAYYNEIGSQTQSNIKYPVTKAAPASLTRTQNQSSGSESSSIPRSFSPHLSENISESIQKNSTFNFFPVDENTPETKVKLLDEQSSSIDPSNRNVSNKYFTSYSSPSSSSVGQRASPTTFQKYTTESQTQETSENTFITIGKQSSGIHPDSDLTNPRELNSNNGNANFSVLSSDPDPVIEVNSGRLDSPGFYSNGIEWLSGQNGNQFDPQFFGVYRDHQKSISVGDNFNPSIFHEDLVMPIFSNILQAVPNSSFSKDNLVSPSNERQNGEEKIKPSGERKDLLGCKLDWDPASKCKGSKDGDLDLDNLCSELQIKAKCSESGRKYQCSNPKIL